MTVGRWMALGLLLPLAGCGWIRPRSDFERDPFVMSHLTKDGDDGVAWGEKSDRRLSFTSHKPGERADAPRDRRAHADDYHWIVGRLDRSTDSDAGWIVIYENHVGDRYEGQLPLEKSSQLGLVREGDRVLLEGEVVTTRAGEHEYRVRSLALLD